MGKLLVPDESKDVHYLGRILVLMNSILECNKLILITCR